MTGVFDAYARYYDLLYRDKDYVAEAGYVASQIRSHAPDARRILELGCGTAAHAEQLAQMGFSVHGIDLSESMLAAAERRKSRLPPDVASRLSFSRADVASVRAGQPFDVVISLFHVMSYQVTNDALAAAFKTAAANLRPGGLFLYDFWYGPAVLTQKPDTRVKRLRDADVDVTRIAEPVVHWNENVVDVNYTVFVERNDTGALEKLCETHRMRYLFPAELVHYYSPSFRERATCAWMETAHPTADSWAALQVLTRI
ncbi:MAG TPA: class I SAM-dependent methyltransferase [Burkholderiales bacterium]|nr:class I SAM-dependent methyltransferase [Burkholderiales bacterium]